MGNFLNKRPNTVPVPFAPPALLAVKPVYHLPAGIVDDAADNESEDDGYHSDDVKHTGADEARPGLEADFDFGFEETVMVDSDSLIWANWRAGLPAKHNLIPVPNELIDNLSVDLREITDEEILRWPPHLIAHLMRTKASGSLQVISPRQCPLARTCGPPTDKGAEKGDSMFGAYIHREGHAWATFDGTSVEHWFSGEPPMLATHSTIPTPTVRETLGAGGVDVISRSLSVARSLIDLQNHPDVDGDGDRISELISRVWGISRADLEAPEGIAIAPGGDLARYALSADSSNAIAVGTVNQIGAISVAGMTADRHSLGGPDAMVPHDRMRAMVTQVLIQSAGLERHNYRSLAVEFAPRAFGWDINDSRYLHFRAMSGSTWIASASSFQILIGDAADKGARNVRVPRLGAEITDELNRRIMASKTKYQGLADEVRAVARAITYEAAAGKEEADNAGTLMSVVRKMGKIGLNTQFRAYDGTRLLRGIAGKLFEVDNIVEGLSLYRACKVIKLARKHESPAVCNKAVGLLADHNKHIGARLMIIGAQMASLRGNSADKWWAQVYASIPRAHCDDIPDAYGWAYALLYHLSEPSDQGWANTSAYLSYKSVHQTGQWYGRGDVFDPVPGSRARTLGILRAYARDLGRLHAAKHVGTSRGCYAMSRALEGTSRASGYKAAAAAWALRGRCLKTVFVKVVALDSNVDEYRDSFKVNCKEGETLFVIGMAPDRAYGAFRGALIDLYPGAERLYKKRTGNALVSQLVKCNSIRSLRDFGCRYTHEPLVNTVGFGNKLESDFKWMCTDIAKEAARHGVVTDLNRTVCVDADEKGVDEDGGDALELVPEVTEVFTPAIRNADPNRNKKLREGKEVDRMSFYEALTCMVSQDNDLEEVAEEYVRIAESDTADHLLVSTFDTVQELHDAVLAASGDYVEENEEEEKKVGGDNIM